RAPCDFLASLFALPTDLFPSDGKEACPPANATGPATDLSRSHGALPAPILSATRAPARYQHSCERKRGIFCGACALATANSSVPYKVHYSMLRMIMRMIEPDGLKLTAAISSITIVD